MTMRLTPEDWHEIYQTLKARSEPLPSDGDVVSDWRAHLRRIVATIGPYGRDMWNDSEGAKP